MTEYVNTFMETKAPRLDPSWQVSASKKFIKHHNNASQKSVYLMFDPSDLLSVDASGL